MVSFVEPAIIAALVTIALGGILTAFRYVFDVQLVNRQEVDEKIEIANEKRQDDFDRIIERLDAHGEQIDEVRELIMGAEYQVDDGMLELVEATSEQTDDQEERITGVERVQLKIRRRQREHSGGDPVARGEDIDPPPAMDTDLHKEDSDES